MHQEVYSERVRDVDLYGIISSEGHVEIFYGCKDKFIRVKCKSHTSFNEFMLKINVLTEKSEPILANVRANSISFRGCLSYLIALPEQNLNTPWSVHTS